MRKPSQYSKFMYYSGGLAEIVPRPTLLTYSFLRHWFTGKRSLGQAMKLLNVPYETADLPILEYYEGELFVNLLNEQKILYDKTIFSYQTLKPHDPPRLKISFKKFLFPKNIFQTIKILSVQSSWIAHPNNVITTAKSFLQKIPTSFTENSANKMDDLLEKNVWPYVLAIGMMHEFYSMLKKDLRQNDVSYISSGIAKKDWFFQSISDQKKVKSNLISFAEYIKKYRLRSDNDYELTSPRWWEIPNVIQKRIQAYPDSQDIQPETHILPTHNSEYLDTVIELQCIRSEAKRKALYGINTFRQLLMKQFGDLKKLENTSRNELFFGTNDTSILNQVKPHNEDNTLKIKKGRGTGVSSGIAQAYTCLITKDASGPFKNIIGIFPDAGPEYSHYFPKCKGIIFQKGGQTSHGAILAREFGIPALVFPNASSISNGQHIEINGLTGEWKLID